MIFDVARLAFSNLFAPETRSVLWKVIGLTLLVLVGLWLALRETFLYFALPFIDQWMPGTPDWAGWLTFVIGLFASLGLALGLALLMAPVTALIAGFFLDDVAEVVERRDYPADPTGRALPLGEAMLSTVKFLGVVIVGNLCALFLLLLPGINLIAFFVVNAYLLSREYFEFAAMRHLSPAAAREFRAKHSRAVLASGVIIAAFLAVPILNLATPLFAGAMMAHLYKKLAARDPTFSQAEEKVQGASRSN
ncbi:CysZ protein [Pararhizobium capsulatum DSM 1112]|uniref:CysZ protein n=1 Tax=Pararhizobium capsulatum DSM 1112 TaxID=1121113 RepID=A0ABU0BN49_9HYPH|nr:sulfate transporter family protein [Pararhizobium capsulatum]MDQ0318307.1 CysZ protein [Pararhizobium capsulatum DSM 1112]